MTRAATLALAILAAAAGPAIGWAAPQPGSLEDCDARVAAAPEDLASYLCYYHFARRTLDYEGARRRLERLASEEPARTHARLYLARLLSVSDVRGTTETLRGCADEYAAAGDAVGEAWARDFLAENLLRLNRPDEAEREVERAASLVPPTGDFSLLGVVRVQQAQIARLRGDDARAWSLLRSLELMPEFETQRAAPLRCRAWEVLSLLAARLGWMELSSVYARRMEDEAHAPELSQCRGLAQGRLARNAVRLAEDGRMPREEALAIVQRALEIVREEKDPVTLWSLTADEAMLLDDEAAIARLAQLERETGSPWGKRFLFGLLGTRIFASDPRRYAEAEAVLERALDVALETGHPPHVTEGFVDLALLRLDGGERDAAIDGALAALDAVERFQDLQSGERLGAIRVAGFASVYYALVNALLAGTPTAEDLERAFAVGERMRSRTLIEHLLQATGPADQESDEARRRLEVLRQISRVQIELMSAEPGEHEALTRELVRLEEEETLLRGALRGRDAALDVARPRELPPVKEIRRELLGDEALLSFLLTPRARGGSRLFVLTSTDLRTYPLVDADSIAEAARLWLLVLRREDGTDTAGAARLYRDLLQPALDDLAPGIQRLVIVPDGALHRIPFDALRPGPGAPALVERYELTLTPSAAVWLHLRRLAAEPGWANALLMADPDTPLSGTGSEDLREAWSLDVPLGRLPNARVEVHRARRALGGRAELRLGAEASEAYLAGSDLRRFGMVHLAAHAVVDERDPGRSAILLAPGSAEHDGLLQPREVIDLDFAGAAVTLSACHTAGGEVLAGEGVMGLARSFFQARASTVVGSLWPVRDRETAQLMDAFYRELARGQRVAAALAAAKRERIRAGAPAAAWAGVVALGAGSQAPWPEGTASLPSRATWVLAIVALLAAAAAAAWLLTRRRRAWPLLAAAAVLALAFVVAPLVVRRASAPPADDAFREPGGAGGVRSAIDESVPLPRAECRLRWTGAPPGTVFTVEVATEDLRVLHRAEGLESDEYLVPELALGPIAAGDTILWHVEALLPDGRRTESAMFRARLE